MLGVGLSLLAGAIATVGSTVIQRQKYYKRKARKNLAFLDLKNN